MLRARCQEPGCSWTFETNDPVAMQTARDAHFESHPWELGDDERKFPRYPSMSDDRQLATGTELPVRIQGATILDASCVHGVVESPLSPQAVAHAIGEAAQHDADVLRSQMARMVPQQVSWPLTPSPDPVSVYWTIFNRWTGKFVHDPLGNEHAASDFAYQFLSEQDAVQFARNITGKPLATARAQPPPDDAPHCYDCGTANARGTVICVGCRRTIVVATSWITVSPRNAEGHPTGPSIWV